MPKKPQAAQGSAAVPRKKFKDMDGSEKLGFVGKLFLFLLTAGFAYPNILQD
jgi:hypothetical protein